MKKLFTLCFLLVSLLSLAQSTTVGFRYDLRPVVTVNGQTLLNPWAGGLNAAQYSTIRLNNDTRDDLVVFDRTTRKITTFVAIDNPTGSGIAWQHAPQYELRFPAVYNWMLLVDYDKDGRKDLFTHGSGSMRVFRNESANNQVTFQLVADPLNTEGFSSRLPLYVSASDIPAITDYDDDGDIDILTFDPTGNQIAYQQNMSMERTRKPNLDFKRVGGSCWGRFQKEFCNDFKFGIQCDTEPGGGGLTDPKPPGSVPGARPLHTGNTVTILNADGKKDMLFGFVSCANLARLRSNGPNNDKAAYVAFDSLFPEQNPVLFPAFPAAFLEDVDGDGLTDLLASPNVDINENQAFDFRASSWFYKNVGTNQKSNFRLVRKDFLQNDMLDLGERAAPALADLDGDGDADMVVGYAGIQSGSEYRAGLWYFENRGTTQNPAFVLSSTDYLDVAKTLNLSNIVPSFVDIDNNGSVDLLLTGNGARGVEMRVLVNASPKGTAAQYNLARATIWPTPSLMQLSDLPTVADIDRDGKPDLLISKSNGTILHYRNAGTAQTPTFQLQNQRFGGFTDDGSAYVGVRSLVVTDVNGDQKNELITANGDGRVRIYRFPEGTDAASLSQPLTLLDSLPAIGLPGISLIAAAADLDGDQLPDLMLGSQAGGLRYLKNVSEKIVITASPEEPVSPWAFPNPTDRYLTVRPPYDGQVDVLSLSGQVVLSAQAVQANRETQFDLANLPDGTYLLRLTSQNRPAQNQKIVVWK
ncbi:FG-GAP-like repeat-containing protein [Spirosoma montaniterrae]|uniref:Secretion system C-terminal sorting domain-containing protein n=1 Tax=Spirosoma montaniterrae TaxID=1178516 RepID=A0A1P9WZH8_9BACT|nr:FG-GAP-like repeat-containing protein [Spirosoma montaniterrae]AQG80786.1 hypothetical protein AWR27_16555 [Spirosoma montaniterrae]